MMAFFLVMWLMGSDEETKAAIAHYFNHPNTPWKNGADPKSDVPRPLGDRVGLGESILQGQEGMVPDDLAASFTQIAQQPKEFIELSELVQEVFDGQLVALDVNIDYMRFSVPDLAFFAPGSAQLRKGSDKPLEKLGQIFRGFKGQITIASHTDDLAKGTFSNLYEFTMARAVSVMNFMVENRFAPEERLVPMGSGAKRNLASADAPDSQKKNRRIEFVLTHGR